MRLTKSIFKILIRQKKYTNQKSKTIDVLYKDIDVLNSIRLDLHTLENSNFDERLSYEDFRDLYYSTCKYLTKESISRFLVLPVDKIHPDYLYEYYTTRSNIIRKLFVYVSDNDFLLVNVNRNLSSSYLIDDSKLFNDNLMFINIFNKIFDYEDTEVYLKNLLNYLDIDYISFKFRTLSYVSYKKHFFKDYNELTDLVLNTISVESKHKIIYDEFDKYELLQHILDVFPMSSVFRALKTDTRNKNINLEYILKHVKAGNELGKESILNLEKLIITDELLRFLKTRTILNLALNCNIKDRTKISERSKNKYSTKEITDNIFHTLNSYSSKIYF